MNRAPIARSACRRALYALSLYGLLFQSSPVRALSAEVEARIVTTDDTWVGQRLTLQIDLETDGQSFSAQRFRIPEVPGALLLEDAVATTKFTTPKGDAIWSILRYEYPLFPQRPGTLTVPPIAAEFEISAGFGRETRRVEFTTPALDVLVRAPPGVREPRNLVTTRSFTLEVVTEPEVRKLHVGDAATRTVTRKAVDVPGLVFVPLPTPKIAGVGVYPKPVRVEDKQYRGELSGIRSEAVTFVFQEAGTVRLPAVALQWWDPADRRLHTATIPELEFEIAPASDARQRPATLADTGRMLSRHGQLVTIAFLGAALCFAALYRWRARLRSALQRIRERRAASETACYRALVRACAAREPAVAYRAYQTWSRVAASSLGPVDRFEPQLDVALERVQRALIGRELAWDGHALAGAVAHARRVARARVRALSNRALPPLNPTGTA